MKTEHKEYIAVTADYSPDGDIMPVSIEFDDRKKYRIERVLSAILMSSTKHGGNEIRYSVTIRGQHEYLYLEPGKIGKWYVIRNNDT